MELEKCYSTNNEDFTFTEFDDLVADLDGNGDLVVGATYYEADFKRVSGADIVSIDRVIEDMDERLYDLVGESAEDGCDASNEAIQELKDFIVQWVDKNTDIKRYYTIVGKSRQMQITEDDMPPDSQNAVQAAAGGLTQTAVE